MFAIYFEESYVDEYGESRMSNYVIRETRDACYRAMEFFNIAPESIAYESGAECESREEALAFCAAEWFGITDEQAEEALRDDFTRRRFESWEMKVDWDWEERESEYWESYDEAMAERERELKADKVAFFEQQLAEWDAEMEAEGVEDATAWPKFPEYERVLYALTEVLCFG